MCGAAGGDDDEAEEEEEEEEAAGMEKRRGGTRSVPRVGKARVRSGMKDSGPGRPVDSRMSDVALVAPKREADGAPGMAVVASVEYSRSSLGAGKSKS